MMANVLKMAEIQAILSLHSAGLSRRAIARQLGVDRGTVTKVIQSSQAVPKPAKAPSGSEGSKPASLEGFPGPSSSGAPWMAESAGDVGDGSPSKPAKAPSGSDPGICGTTATAGPGEGVCSLETTVRGRSACDPFRDLILAKVREELSAQRIYQDLVNDARYTGSYYSVRRFVQKLTSKLPLPMRRMECAPGFEAQVDYGSGAPILMPDGHRRKTNVFRLVLSHSRKGYSVRRQLSFRVSDN